MMQNRKSAFRRYTQYNLDHTEKMIRLTIRYPMANAILLFLVDQMDTYNAVVCSNKVLQEVFDVSESTVKRGIKNLKDGGYITVLKSGTSNVYAINDSIYWKTWGNKRQDSKFSANVILTMSEQDEDYRQTSLFSSITTERHKEVKLRKKGADARR